MGDKAKKTRGRPREFDPEEALGGASSLFLRKGFSGSSLDGLAEAMGISKPSLYGTYGDKAALYLRALEVFAAQMQGFAGESLGREESLEASLRRFLRDVLDIYYVDGELGLGCLVMSTAVTEAVEHPQVREVLAEVLKHVDTFVAHRIHAERGVTTRSPSKGDLALARIVTGVFVSFSARARAGEPREELQRLADSTAALVALGVGEVH